MNDRGGCTEADAGLTPLWTAREAAECLGMGESSFRFYVFGGRIPHYKISGYFRSGIVRFHPEDIRRWGRMREAGKEEWIEMAKAIDGGKDKMMTIEELAEGLTTVSEVTIQATLRTVRREVVQEVENPGIVGVAAVHRERRAVLAFAFAAGRQ